MTKLWSVRKAFGYFGTVPKNDRWSWSARSQNGDVVAVTWWKDQVSKRDGKLVYDKRGDPNLSEWRDRLGNRERIRDLAHARDHCDGLFRTIWAKARDRRERNPPAIERYPDETLWMRLLELDEETGEFLAEEVGNAPRP
jgi:hypothetical protein